VATILRSASAPCYYTMVGKARVSGIMNGEPMKFVEDGLLKENIFHIIISVQCVKGLIK
jgi:hypothetical protein